MNYYPFHIGDYHSHTAHLDPLEDIAYRRMIDLYYLQEGPLPLDAKHVARLIRMREHEQIVGNILAEFFTETEDGWVSERCEEEIAAASDKREKAKASAAASVAARKAKSERPDSDRSTGVERPLSDGSAPNPNPNPKDISTPDGVDKAQRKAARFDPLAIELPPEIGRKAWERWVAYRRKARKGLTDDAVKAQVKKLVEWAGKGHDIAEIIDESIRNGWQGLFEPKRPPGGFNRAPVGGRQAAIDNYAAQAAQARGENYGQGASTSAGDGAIVIDGEATRLPS